MKIIYALSVNTAYCRTMIDRYYRQRPFLFWLPVQFGLLGCIFGVWIGWTIGPLSGLIVGVSVLVVGVALTKVALLLRFRVRHDFGQDFTVAISDDGVEAMGQHVQSTWQWGAYPRAVRFSDGILLLRAGVIRWLPDSAIREGTAEQATVLVGFKSILRTVA